MDNSECIKRFDGLVSDRAVVQDMWDSIERFITPYRGRFFKDERSEGSIEWKRRYVFDSTAVMAHQNLSASIHGAVTSPSIRWFDMRFREEALNKNKEASKWLQSSGERVYYELQDSNFNLEINETYQDLVGFGTSVLTLEEAPGGDDWDGLNFTSVPLKEAFFEQDWQGRALRFYRRLEWSPQQIISKFGDNVPQNIKDMEAGGNTEKQQVLFVIYPRHNRIAKVGEKQAPSRRPWEYKYILKADANTLGKPGGYYEMPSFVARWRKTSSSMWGNSPATIALADVLTLNAARKMQLIASEKLIDPPTLAEERALINDLDLSAAGLTVVRSVDGIKQFETKGSIAVSDHMIDQLQDAIRNYFFVDQLNFPSPQAQPMTATEAQIRYELMQRLLGPTLGRLQSDLLDPIVSRTFRMLARAGEVEPPPQIVLDNDANFDIEYMGSLSRSQRVDQAASIERWVGNAAAVGEVFPEALDVVDADEAMRYAGRNLNVPAAIMRDEKEVQLIRSQRQQAQAEAQAAAQAQMEGEAMKAQGEGEQALEQAGQP